MRARSKENVSQSLIYLRTQKASDKVENTWRTEIIAHWSSMKDNAYTKAMYKQGIPAAVRGIVWRLCLGNACNVTPEQYCTQVCVV